MAFPVLFLTIALVAGIAAASSLHFPPAFVLAGTGAVLAAAWIFFGRRKSKAAFLLLLAAAAGLGAGTFSTFDRIYEKNELRNLPTGEYLDFAGTVFRSPAPGLEHDDIYLRVESVGIRGSDRPMRGRLRVSVKHSGEGAKLPALLVGDRIRLSAQIVPPSEYRNFEEPFSATYLKTQNLHILGSAKSPYLVERIGTDRRFFHLRWISKLRQACLRRIEQSFAAPGSPGGISPEGAIFEALVLGERSRMDAETTLALQKTGLYHLFAISGAHIALVSALLFFFFRFLRLSERPSYALLLVLLVFYGLLVEGRASVVRAVIMAAAFIIGKLLWKDVHLLNTISLSALAILCVQPYQLFDAGFQLTYAATLGLILFFPSIRSVLPKLPFKIEELFALSIAAQVAVMPIIATTFHRVIFSGLILNLIGIPLVTVVMAAGYVFLPVAFVFPFLAGAAAEGLAFLLRVFLASTRLLDGLPFLSSRIPTPPGLMVIAYYAFLLLLLLPSRFARSRRIAFLGFAASLAILATYPFSSAVKDLTITVIDVGQGDSILVEFPGKSKMLVDGGGLPTGTFDVGESVVSPFLWDKGIKKIDRLVLTHPHPDHLNGLTAVARNFRIGEFWEGTPAPEDPRYRLLQDELRGVVHRRIVRGFGQSLGGVDIAALAPAVSSETDSPDNDSSLVFRLTYGPTAFLLTGDIGREIEKEILAAGIDVRAQVLKAPHHGSDSSSSEEFLAAVRPEYVVISAGRGNRIRLPHSDVLTRYEKCGARILRTDHQGAVEFRSDGRRLSVRTSERRPPGKTGALAGESDGTLTFDLTSLVHYHLHRQMNIGKIVAAVVLLAVGASLSAQDLASAARKEKERRAGLKDKSSVVVTNADLTQIKKKAAIAEAKNEAQEQPAAAEGEPAELVKKPTAVPAEPDEAVVVDTAFNVEALRAELQDKYNRAKEHLDYLNLKMRALQQQFFSFNTMDSKARVQQDIAKTNTDIQAAVADEAGLKKELEDFASQNPIK